jgi:hypothetical protein
MLQLELAEVIGIWINIMEIYNVFYHVHKALKQVPHMASAYAEANAICSKKQMPRMALKYTSISIPV